MREHSFDLVVVGSGLAGLVAAIVARQAGLSVGLCSKSRPGTGSCSAISQGHFRTSLSGFPPAEHKRLTLQAGRGINLTNLVDLLVARAERSVRALREYGVEIQARTKGFDSCPEEIGREGRSITGPLVRFAVSSGVELLSPFLVRRIVQSDGRAAGVMGSYAGRDETVFVAAGSVLLATGGAGALYARTDNPQGMIGDGFALALQAGLTLMDMEFVQFYPLCLASASRTSLLLPPLLAEVGEIVNERGESIVEKYGITTRPLAIAARDELCQAMIREIREGDPVRGNLQLRLSRDDAVWRKAAGDLGYGQLDRLRSWTDRLLAGREGLPVLPAAHFCMGGVVIDEAGRTDLPGLLAAGEVVGGLHGANRHGGNALAEAAVFGRIAGETAAETAASGGASRISSKERPAKLQRGHEPGGLSSPGKRRGASSAALRRELQEIMWRDAGVIRSAESLQRALEGIYGLKGAVADPERGGPSPELSSMLQVSEAMVLSALNRQETRGSHFREDFPESRESWRGHLLVSLDSAFRTEFRGAESGLA